MKEYGSQCVRFLKILYCDTV